MTETRSGGHVKNVSGKIPRCTFFLCHPLRKSATRGQTPRFKRGFHDPPPTPHPGVPPFAHWGGGSGRLCDEGAEHGEGVRAPDPRHQGHPGPGGGGGGAPIGIVTQGHKGAGRGPDSLPPSSMPIGAHTRMGVSRAPPPPSAYPPPLTPHPRPAPLRGTGRRWTWGQTSSLGTWTRTSTRRCSTTPSAPSGSRIPPPPPPICRRTPSPPPLATAEGPGREDPRMAPQWCPHDCHRVPGGVGSSGRAVRRKDALVWLVVVKVVPDVQLFWGGSSPFRAWVRRS